MPKEPHPLHPSPETRRPEGSHRPRGRGSRRVWWMLTATAGLLLLIPTLARHWGQPRRPPAPAPTAPPATDPTVSPDEQALRETLARLPHDPDAHRALARYLLDQQRPFEALWHFRRALDLNLQDEDSAHDSARALIHAGLPTQARPWLQAPLSAAERGGRVSARPPPSGSSAATASQTRLLLAEAALSMGQPDAALAALSGAGEALSVSAPAQILLGDGRWTSGDETGARRAYQRAAALEPESAAAHDRLGRIALASGKWAQARQSFRAAAERSPDPGYGCRLGLAHWKGGERQPALQLWEAVAAGAPGYAPVHLWRGRALRQARRLDEAAAELAAAVKADPRLMEAQQELAEVMLAMGRRSSALYQRGLFYLGTDRPHRALACFRKMATVNPDSAAAPLMASFCWMQAKQYRPAALEAERGLRAHPGDPALRQRLAMLQMLTGRSRAAVDLCRVWLSEQPAAPEPHRLLAHAAFNASQYRDAAAHYERALALDATDAETWVELGKTLLALRQGDSIARAETAFRRALELTPGHAEAHQGLAQALRRRGRLEEARRQFLRALDLDRSLVPAAAGVVEIATALGEQYQVRLFSSVARALQARRRQADLLWRKVGHQPADAAAHERLAHLLLEAGDLRRAAYQLEQVVELAPSHRSARQQLRVVLRLLALQEP